MSLDSIIAKTNLITRDFGESFEARVPGDGVSERFDLPSDNVDPGSLTVWTTDGTTLTTLVPAPTPPAAPGQYVIEPREGVITLGAPVTVGLTLMVDGVGSLWAIPADIAQFVEIAFDLHAKGRVPALDIDNLSPSEEYAIALLAVREALWAEIAEHAHQVDITTPEGIHIPGGQQFNQLMSMLNSVDSKYRELSQALNIGPFRIEMFDLRRVSRTTNKLVPLYLPQEFDDYSTPVRIYPPIDPGV
jgi:hypothetical protein